jgi:hypothetical protein
MYKVYATKSDSNCAPDYKTLLPYEYQRRTDASKQCVELFSQGYTIHKVVYSNRQKNKAGKREPLLARAIEPRTMRG